MKKFNLKSAAIEALYPAHRALTRLMMATGMILSANTQAMCASFKSELFNGLHQFGSPTIVSRTSLTAPTADTFFGALYFATATINKGTTVYTSSGEATGTGYTAAGKTLGAWAAPSNDGTSAITTPSASVSWAGLTISTSFDTLLVYNQTQSNRAVSVHVFGATTITAGTLTLTMPTNATGTALLQIT
jgi:hypothetical protein